MSTLELNMEERQRRRYRSKRRPDVQRSILGVYIDDRLAELGKSQEWLAEQVGILPSRLSRALYGAALPHDVLIHIAGALQVDAAELLTMAADKGKEPDSSALRVAYIAKQLQVLVDESSEERAAEVLDHFEALVRLLRGK